ncbi:hypothetical protein Peur_004594 [Populus x canadensis]
MRLSTSWCLGCVMFAATVESVLKLLVLGVLLVCFCCVAIFAITELYGACSGGTVATTTKYLSVVLAGSLGFNLVLLLPAVFSEDILLLLGIWFDCWSYYGFQPSLLFCLSRPTGFLQIACVVGPLGSLYWWLAMCWLFVYASGCRSGVGIVSPSSLVEDGLDGSGVDSLEGEKSISSIALENSSATTNAISWVFDLFTSVQGPGWGGTSPAPSSLFYLYMMIYQRASTPFDQHEALLLILYAAVCNCNDVYLPEIRDMLSGSTVFWWCELYVGMLFWLVCLSWLLCLCEDVGVNLDMCGVLLGEGFLCLLRGPIRLDSLFDCCCYMHLNIPSEIVGGLLGAAPRSLVCWTLSLSYFYSVVMFLLIG